MQRLTCFISSTVKDLSAVRQDLESWFESRGVDPRRSDADNFQVAINVTSHQACLRAVEDCHFLVLLIGGRYGGKYEKTLQSITWREYDEARRLKIPVIALVLRSVNEAAERWSRRGRKPNDAEEILGDEPGQLVEFIDAVRKGHVDNWLHLWDGSASHAQSIIQHRLNAIFVSYLKPHDDLRIRAERFNSYAAARRKLELITTAALRLERAQRGAAPGRKPWVCDLLLDVVETNREALLAFRPDARYNIAVYRLVRGRLEVFSRRCDPRIRQRNRPWKPSRGHIGLAFSQRETLVARNLRHTASWVKGTQSDLINYVSAVATPIRSGEHPIGVLVVTSDRADQFYDPEQTEVLTIESLALSLELFADWSAS